MKELLQKIIEFVTLTQAWRSVYRRKHDGSKRSNVLAVVGNFFMHWHPIKIQRHAVAVKYTWCMGGFTFFMFLFLTLTGLLLMFYYNPNVRDAFWDVKDLNNNVAFGKILRNTHRWGAHLMVITVMIHMFRVFMTGSYKAPREFNWVMGIILLKLTFLLSFTGYLLTWDQLGMWAITVGTNMARATPFLGHEGPFGEQLGLTAYNDIRFALLGGSLVGPNALLRAYIWHCVGIPIVVAFLAAIHFWRVRKDGFSGPL